MTPRLALLFTVALLLAACHEPRVTPAYPEPPPDLAPASNSLVPNYLDADTARPATPDSLRDAVRPPDSMRGLVQPPSP